MDDENTSTKSRKRISSKKLANKKFHQDQNTSSSSNNSTSFQSASFVSSENVPQPMLVDSPSSTRRVPLTELLNYDPLIENVAPWTFSNTATMHQTTPSGVSINSTRTKPTTDQRVPLSDMTNTLPRLPATNSFSARPTTTSSLNFVPRTRGRPPKRDISIGTFNNLHYGASQPPLSILPTPQTANFVQRTFSNTPTTLQTNRSGSSISSTPTQQTSHQRPSLSDLTNARATATSLVDFVPRPRGRPRKKPTTTTNSPNQTNSILSPLHRGMNPLLRKNTYDTFPTPTKSGPASVNTNCQPYVSTTPNTVGVIRSPNSEISTFSQTTLCCNTIGGENISTLSPNSVTKSSDKMTPAASTRKRNCTSTDDSNVTLQTPCVTPVNERPTHELKSCSATNRSVLTTQKSTYEVGESSRRPKRSKRPTLQSPTPISFNLVMTSMYEMFMTNTSVYHKNTTTMEILHLSVQNVMLCYGNKKREEEILIRLTNLTVYAVERENSSSKMTAPSKSKQPLDRNIMNQIKDVLDESSDLVKTFRRAREAYTEDNEQNIKIKLIAKRGKDGRQYDLPTANEVAGLIVGDVDACVEDRDIRINIFHPMYLALQYPLLMPCAQDGYTLGIPHINTSGKPKTKDDKEKTVTMKQWFSYQIQDRPNQENLFLRGGLRVSDDEKKNITLFWIEELMRSRGTTLRRFPEMPYPDDRYISEFGNRLIYDETHYNPEELQDEYVRLYFRTHNDSNGVYNYMALTQHSFANQLRQHGSG
ncbi:hypothetical protein CTI12_AA283010 [Artemisia annua]|uniref:Helitron helicase-like domain-containing protein n=1 Tax=Artemisia annua TaxID=35608 RepID=A0A2U1NCM2_ARTAN|nr:hypothetical protein CTI12_AA283010 [Artemisia annua]